MIFSLFFLVATGIASFVVSLVLRLFTTYLSLLGNDLNLKERMFIAIAWSPKVGGRKESIECSNYSLNHVLNLGCHWFCFAGLSSTEGLHRANRRGVWNTGELLSYRNLLDPMKGGKVEL